MGSTIGKPAQAPQVWRLRGWWLAGLLIVLGGGIATQAQAGALYRWTDPDGTVHFSDSLPLEAPGSGFEGPPPPTVGEALAKEAEERRIAEREARRLAIIEAEKAARLEAAFAEAEALLNQKVIVSPYDCDEARKILAGQREPRRTYYSVDDEGRFQPSSAEQASALIAEWEQAVEQLCAEGVKVVAPGTEEAEKALAENPAPTPESTTTQ